jgi:putative transposase
MILHRPIPDGFKVKTAAIIKKVDGYYITLSLQDSSVPVLTPDIPGMENTIGIDVGLNLVLAWHSRLYSLPNQGMQRMVSTL